MKNQNDLEYIKDQISLGKMTVDQANVEMVRMERIRIIKGSVPRDVRNALHVYTMIIALLLKIRLNVTQAKKGYQILRSEYTGNSTSTASHRKEKAMKQQTCSNCKHYSGDYVDLVPYGSTNAEMVSGGDCLHPDAPEYDEVLDDCDYFEVVCMECKKEAPTVDGFCTECYAKAVGCQWWQ